MKDTFGVIAPERQARRQYDRLIQSGNVFKYVSETRRLVQLMKPMPMICPGEADVIHNFITRARAKPPLQEWPREHCPVNYWTSSAQVYEKVIQFGTNHDPTLTRALAGPKLLGAMSGKPKNFTALATQGVMPTVPINQTAVSIQEGGQPFTPVHPHSKGNSPWYRPKSTSLHRTWIGPPTRGLSRRP
jgi:hypothetical protein